MKITRTTTLGEAIENFPKSAEIMMKHGLHCVGCHIAVWETIEQGCMSHGIEDKEIDEMIKEINESKR